MDREKLTEWLMDHVDADVEYGSAVVDFGKLADALREQFRIIPWTDVVTETTHKTTFSCEHDICVIHGSAEPCPAENP